MIIISRKPKILAHDVKEFFTFSKKAGSRKVKGSAEALRAAKGLVRIETNNRNEQ